MKSTMKTMLCLLLALLLTAALLSGCAEKPASSADTQNGSVSATGAQTPDPDAGLEELGEGNTEFYLDVTFSETESRHFRIHTDAETVGAALNALGLVGGRDGLYNTVCGKTLDWDADKMYWAFYVDGGYASAGLDDTPIVSGSRYALIATAG